MEEHRQYDKREQKPAQLTQHKREIAEQPPQDSRMGSKLLKKKVKVTAGEP